MEILGSTLFSLLAMLVTLGILVTIHEYGHFIVARLCGVHVERFSIGFGKPLLSWRGKPAPDSNEEPTEYVIAMLPLGGYVKMLGEQGGEQDELDPARRARSFTHKPLYQRTAIVAAGPLANFLLAIVLYWGIFLAGVDGLAPVVGDVVPETPAAVSGLQSGDEILAVDGKEVSTWQDVRVAFLDRLGESGQISLLVQQGEDGGTQHKADLPIERWLASEGEPDLLGSLGMVPYHMIVPAVLDEVLPGGRAEAAGLQSGDRIVASRGEEIRHWNMWLEVVRTSAGQALEVELERDGQRLTVELVPEIRLADNGAAQLDAQGQPIGYIGASVVVPRLPESMRRAQTYSLPGAFTTAIGETVDNSLFVLDSIRKMLLGAISVKNLSGPITIAQVAGETASVGLEYYVSFLALLSISLGVLNLLPIPMLDGGHLFYYAIEAVIRRPVPRRMQEVGMQLGMMLVGCIMFLALFNDINRLF